MSNHIDKKYACGMINLLWHAIRQHEITFYGERPKRFELHPEVIASLWQELNETNNLSNNPSHFWNLSELKFLGVPIIEDALAKEAKLINSKNQIVYL